MLLGHDVAKLTKVDLVDVVNDQMWASDYLEAEDPTIFVSEKTGRGPLTQSWIDDADSIMCAYKLCKVCNTVYILELPLASVHTSTKETRIGCLKPQYCEDSPRFLSAPYRVLLKSDKTQIDIFPALLIILVEKKVEFRYWGMQSKIEKFIHDVGLRKTMLRAHRQAWAWQDEWNGLTIADIRRLEEEAQKELAQRMREFAKQEVNKCWKYVQYDGSKDDLDWRIGFRYLNFN